MPLLPGEPDDAIAAEEIDFWVDVYSELSKMLHRLLESLDVPAPELTAHVEELDRRRGFWLRRRGWGAADRHGTGSLALR